MYGISVNEQNLNVTGFGPMRDPNGECGVCMAAEGVVLLRKGWR
jgi:hypothetical protein